MDKDKKREVIAKVVTLLESLIGDDDNSSEIKIAEEPIQILTIKECTNEIKGLNEFTIRQLIARNEIPYVRAGQGKNGKILIPKAALVNYLNGGRA